MLCPHGDMIHATAEALRQEAALRRDAQAWEAPSDCSQIPVATEEEVPVIDLGPFLQTGAVREAAAQLREAGRRAGFHYIRGHGVPQAVLDDAFAATKWFHALPPDTKLQYAMDAAPGQPPGVGYLPLHNFKLPARVKGNVNESFIVKQEIGPRDVTLDKMPWPQTGRDAEDAAFRRAVLAYCNAMQQLSKQMLPLYAAALGLPPDHFDPAFEDPLFRLRLTHYPPVEGYEEQQYGIAPHVDTSFFTVLASDRSGLVVRAARGWVRVGHRDGCLVVNTGQLLRQATNDTWNAVQHFALNAHRGPRHSLIFFFNATPTYRMPVVPTCVTADRPAKYPPTSYLEGQGVAQGE